MVTPVCVHSGRSAQVGLLIAYWVAVAPVWPRSCSVAPAPFYARSVRACLWSQAGGPAAQRDAAQHAAPSSLAAAIVAAWRGARRPAAPRAGPGLSHVGLEQARHGIRGQVRRAEPEQRPVLRHGAPAGRWLRLLAMRYKQEATAPCAIA